MAGMSFTDLASAVGKGDIRPLYLLHGDEPFFIDRATDLFAERLLSEAEKGFNFTLCYGKDTDARTVIDTALRAPMMAQRQVVIVKEAQQMRDLDQLQAYAERPVPTTVLVLAHPHRKLPANRKLFKAIAKTGAVMESSRIKDHQVADWVQRAVAAAGRRIEATAAQLMQEHLGPDLSRVQSELDKLYLNVPAEQAIAPAHIERFVGISKDYNLFELHTALMRGDRRRAAAIAAYQVAHPKEHPLILIVGSLYTLFSKIYLTHFVGQANDRELASALKVPPFAVRDYRQAVAHYPIDRVERVFAYLQQTDLRSKGIDNGSAEHGDLLRELLVRIAP
jgi:DNA polymerase-3 subunit delta